MLARLEAGSRPEEIRKACAELQTAEAQSKAALAQARQRLADASLYAPADGIIRNRILEPGDMAFPQTPALTLAFLDSVWIRAYLPEPMLGRVRIFACNPESELRLGMPASVEIALDQRDAGTQPRPCDSQ